MKKSNYVWVAVVAVLFILFVVKPQSIMDTFTASKTDTGITDPLAACQAGVQQTKAAYAPYTFPIAECRTCPKANGLYPAQCHFACGTVCPAGMNCYYPSNCPSGCGSQCTSYAQGPTGPYCTNTVQTCSDTSINYWETQVQGCTSAVTLPAYVSFMIGQDEINTVAQTNAEAKYQLVCNGIVSGTTPIPTKNVTVGDPSFCQLSCPPTQVLLPNTCQCVNAVANPPNGSFLDAIWSFIMRLIDWLRGL